MRTTDERYNDDEAARREFFDKLEREKAAEAAQDVAYTYAEVLAETGDAEAAEMEADAGRQRVYVEQHIVRGPMHRYRGLSAFVPKREG